MPEQQSEAKGFTVSYFDGNNEVHHLRVQEIYNRADTLLLVDLEDNAVTEIAHYQLITIYS